MQYNILNVTLYCKLLSYPNYCTHSTKNLISSQDKQMENHPKKKILGLITLGRKYHVASREWGWKEEDCRCEAQLIRFDYSPGR